MLTVPIIIIKVTFFIFQLNYNENLTRFFNSQPRTQPDKEAGDGGDDKDEFKPYTSGNVGGGGGGDLQRYRSILALKKNNRGDLRYDLMVQFFGQFWRHSNITFV